MSMIDNVANNLSGKQSQIFDDGYFLGTVEEIRAFWQFVNTKGPGIGYHSNNKSVVYDLNPENYEFGKILDYLLQVMDLQYLVHLLAQRNLSGNLPPRDTIILQKQLTEQNQYQDFTLSTLLLRCLNLSSTSLLILHEQLRTVPNMQLNMINHQRRYCRHFLEENWMIKYQLKPLFLFVVVDWVLQLALKNIVTSNLSTPKRLHSSWIHKQSC